MNRHDDAHELYREIGPVAVRLASNVHQADDEVVAAIEREIGEGMLDLFAVLQLRADRSHPVGVKRLVPVVGVDC